MNNRRYFANLPIQTRLILIFLLTTALIFIVNVYVYVNMNHIIGRIEALYSSNVSLNELADKLSEVQDGMTDYLKTKSSESLEDYYRYAQEYTEVLGELRIISTSIELLFTKKSIVDLSYTYLEKADEAVNAKRGRNVSKYVSTYAECSRIYDYLNNYIYSLNNEQFKESSGNY